MTVVLIEPQPCFASALASLFKFYAAEIDVRVFNSLAQGAEAVVEADVVLLDADPSLSDPIAATEEVSSYGGRATIVLSTRAMHVSADEAPDALLGIIAKDLSPRDFVDAVLRAARGHARIGVTPRGWKDRRSDGGALRFIGSDRRRRLAAG